MRQTKKVVTVTNQTDLVICNMCGEKITSPKHHDTFLSVSKSWGYGSAHDGKVHSFELCVGCYDKLISQFKVKID